MALEVNDSRQIIIEPIIITNINATGNDWHETVSAPFTYTVTGTDKISVNRNGNTLTITGLALGEASITVTSGNAQTTIPIVVADKVLDVPHIRQEKSLWCWAACAQMVANFYNPDNSGTQSEMVQYALNNRNNVNNTTGDTDDIINIISNYGEKTLTKVTRSNFGGETSLRQKLDNGNSVIYLTNRVNSAGKIKGHFRVIYGYYKLSENEYVYLIYDPWDTCMKYDDSAIGNNIHLDIWQRSWLNILDEETVGIAGVDKLPLSGSTNYSADWFIY